MSGSEVSPRFLTAGQEENRLFAATELLQCAESDAGFEGYDPKTKAQPSVLKKARQVRSNTKVLFTFNVNHPDVFI